MWILPLLVVGTTIVLAIPLGSFMAAVFDGRLRAPRWLNWLESRFDTGPQTWKQYAVAMMFFNVAIFIVGFTILSLQDHLPLNQLKVNPDGTPKLNAEGTPVDTTLSPGTIFNTLCSFLSNTNLQHYSGEVHLSYFSQIFFICWMQFITPSIGLAALAAMIRGLRGDQHMGNFYVDLWRAVVFVFLPLAFILAVLLMALGMPMTLQMAVQAHTVEQPESVFQILARGPVAAIVAIKQLGTNGGGFFGANSCHPFENPNAWTNLLTCIALILVPISCLVMFGRMLKDLRQAAVIFGVMFFLSALTIIWAIGTDTLQPNLALTEHAPIVGRDRNPHTILLRDKEGRPLRDKDGKLRTVTLETAAVPALPINHMDMGNLEGKELRFGTSAGATWSALTTNTSNCSVNCMHDSLNPLAGLTPLSGMWLNCIWGGVGVGLINFLVYLVVGVFLAGLMVGRTPEYLGKKIEAREMKLAMLALLIHPLMILGPTGLFAALDWGTKATNNPGPHGFSEILYEFTSASANNGSGFEGLADTHGFNVAAANPSPPADYAIYWDIACGLVMLISRFIPIIAPLAIAGSLAAKKPTPFTAGTMRTDTVTFGFVLLGTILLVGALLFLPAAILGPVAEHWGPMPFGN
jgi:K+-transporting ATPase ATPase A chain